MEQAKVLDILAKKYGLASPVGFEQKRQLLLLEFKATEESLDIISIYSYFYVNCVQKVFVEGAALNLEVAETFYLELLSSLSMILNSSRQNNQDYFLSSKTHCKKTINMVLEMVFQVISRAHPRIATADTIAIVETITSRVLDGGNLILFSLTLLYLYAYQDDIMDEEAFFVEQKVNLANKTLIGLFRYLHLVLLKLQERDLALNFLRNVISNSCEVSAELIPQGDKSQIDLLLRARMKANGSSLKDYTEFLDSICTTKLKTKQYESLLATLKKAYYVIAMREATRCSEKLEVLHGFIREKISVTPTDTEMLDSLVVKITNRDEFETHLGLFKDMLGVCKEDRQPSYLCFIFLLMIFDEICEFCRRHNDIQVLVKLFLDVQFVRFPREIIEFRKCKALLIKYFPFYMLRNLSCLTSEDPIKEIVDRHLEFKRTFEDSTRPLKIDGLEVGLINPLDLLESKKLKQVVASETTTSEQLLDMFRLEIEIWENFIYQISHFDKIEKKNYQCMLRSVVFHSFLKMFPKLKKKKQKVALGSFLQNLCIHNDELVRLILHQGFDDNLVTDAVEYIGWLHVTLLYSDSLLSQTYDSKKLHFYYKLLADTIKKYPAQVAKDVARNLIVNHFAYVELNPEENSVVLECIKTLLETFPALEQERQFLVQHYRGIQKDLCVFDISYVYIDRLAKDLEKLTVSKPLN